MFGSDDIGIDLGTASVLIYIKGKGIVLREPSVVAIDTTTGKIMAVGENARRMLGRTPGHIVAKRPLRDGVIADYDATERMLRYFLRKILGRRFLTRPRVVACVPSGVSEVEKRSVIDAMLDAGAKNTQLIEEPLAAAIGVGISIDKPYGDMVIDIGGGTTDIAVLSMGRAVVSESIKVAGDAFDEAIIRYMRRKHNLMIGERTAESLKLTIGTTVERSDVIYMDVTGRNLISGLPKIVRISSEEMVEALEEPAQTILENVHAVLERTPPELAADISDRGIIMTGGGSLLYGLDQTLESHIKVPCHVAEDPISCVVNGTGKVIENIDHYGRLLYDPMRRLKHRL